MRLKLAFVAVLFASPAFAQQPQLPYVPFEISQDDFNKIMSSLGEIPAKYSGPLIQAFGNAEQAAVQNHAKAVAEHAPPAPTPSPSPTPDK